MKLFIVYQIFFKKKIYLKSPAPKPAPSLSLPPSPPPILILDFLKFQN